MQGNRGAWHLHSDGVIYQFFYYTLSIASWAWGIRSRHTKHAHSKVSPSFDVYKSSRMGGNFIFLSAAESIAFYQPRAGETRGLLASKQTLTNSGCAF